VNVFRKGFTLLELLVAISIVATLAGVAVPRVLDTIRRQEFASEVADLAQCIGDAQRLAQAPQNTQAQRWVMAHVRATTFGTTTCDVYTIPDTIPFASLQSSLSISSLTPAQEFTRSTKTVALNGFGSKVNSVAVTGQGSTPSNLRIFFGARESGRIVTVAYNEGGTANLRNPNAYTDTGVQLGIQMTATTGECARLVVPISAQPITQQIYPATAQQCVNPVGTP
jgi:prepilin-type N-terminal cleavage/methylation domain-containing protein